jgi:hypothetical protein
VRSTIALPTHSFMKLEKAWSIGPFSGRTTSGFEIVPGGGEMQNPSDLTSRPMLYSSGGDLQSRTQGRHYSVWVQL